MRNLAKKLCSSKANDNVVPVDSRYLDYCTNGLSARRHGG